MIHFGSFDARFCGSKRQGRQFTVDESEITCPRCRENDAASTTYVLTPEAKAWITAHPLKATQ